MGYRSKQRGALLAAGSLISIVHAGAAFAQQSSTTQGVQNTAPSGQAASPSAADAEARGEAANPTPPASLTAAGDEEIIVTGIRASQERAIAVKRNAVSVVDSISAEDIGKLPDVTISDSLQRIPGVQIRRDAGEGGAINVRGLPQVTTLLNGEAYLGASSITTIQPNFTDIPSQLFSGADVIKSTTADLLNAGITGTVNLRTRRPFDLKNGFTGAVTAEGNYGDKAKKYSPNANALAGYRGERFGFLIAGSYANPKLANFHNGIQEGYGVRLRNESASDATANDGFSPPNRPRGNRIFSNGVLTGVDVNGDGDATDTFVVPQAQTAWNRVIERERYGLNGSFQAELGEALELTGDAFFTKQTQFDRTAGFQMQAVNWQGGEYLPGATRDTGTAINGFNLNTTGVYNYDLGNFDSYSETLRTKSFSQNYNLQLKFDNGGRFKAVVRGIYGKAHQYQNQSYLQFNLSNGAQWQPGGIGHYPAALGGDRAFNPGGYTVSTLAGLASLPAVVDFTSSKPVFTLPGQLTTALGDINSYALKTMSSENNYRRNGDLKVARADGTYEFSDAFNLTFGGRYSERSVSNYEFERAAPLYAGQGASNPAGCLVKWKAFDVSMNDATCSAGDSRGFYVAGLTRKANDPSFDGQVKQYGVPVAGVPDIFVLNPKAMDDAVAFQNSFYPGNVETLLPGRSYDVGVKQVSGYTQGNFKADIGIPFSGNFGLRIINTKLDVRQNITGAPRPYGVAPLDIGDVETKRNFTDVLPAVNLAFDLQPELRLRLAYAKTMTLLDLNQWGGGLDVNYAIQTDPSTNRPIFAVTGGNSNGNPQLDPWRADNFDVSLEYYLGRSSLVSLAFFYIDVQSFIENGTIVRTDLPDNDGVVRNRSVTINTPLQGDSGKLKGFEAGWKQSFTDLSFMPGFLTNFGVDANLTYSPSNSGRTDLAGSKVPFQDNSKIQTNLAVFYQDEKFQVRVAHNFRSKRAVSADFGGVSGLQLYQAPTNYVDASVSYDLTPNLTVYAQGSNLTGEYERYYLTFKDQRAYNNIYERRYAAGVRAKF